MPQCTRFVDKWNKTIKWGYMFMNSHLTVSWWKRRDNITWNKNPHCSEDFLTMTWWTQKTDFISETWLMSVVHDSEIQLLGFLLCRSNRLNCRGGGVILYMENALTIRAPQTMARDSGKWEIEHHWLECKRQDIEFVAV